MRIHKLLTLTGILAYGLGAGAYAAADYPERPVSIIVPYAPGGPTDTIARVLAQGLQDETGGNFIIDNAPGAGSTIGAGRAARAKPDGYTILWGSKSTHAVAPHLYAQLQYDPFKSFDAVGMVGSQPYVVAVRTESPFKSVQDLVEKGKADPGALNYSSPGNGSGPHLATELFLNVTGMQAQHIPYKGGAPAMMAVLAGEVDFYLDTPTIPKAQADGGKARLLGVSSPERIKDMPDVPTLKEAGYENLEMKTWFGFFVPAGTPQETIAWLNEKMNIVLKKPEIAERLAAAGLTVEPTSSEDFFNFAKSENERWGKIIKEANITAN